MEKTHCLFGHEEPPIEAFLVTDRLAPAQQQFRIVRCPACGLLFLNPRPTPDEIDQYYQYEAYREEFAPAVEDEPSAWRCWNRRYGLNRYCRLVEKNRPNGGRILDVGCGTGNFLAQLRKRGDWDVQGLDVAPKAVEYARRRLKLPIFLGTLEEARYPTASFDVVTLWNVVEHLHYPLQTLTEVRRILHPDGILAFSVPDAGSWDARLFEEDWVGLDPPRHLYTFSRYTAASLLVETGFRTLTMGNKTGSYHSFVASTRLFIRRRLPIHKSSKQLLAQLVSSFPAHLLIFPFLKTAVLTHHGPILDVIAKPANDFTTGHFLASEASRNRPV
ncbi:methyltransferase domain-containing protein [candidate division KSB3 bacterium]|uniref:Methyltransferase domain-containing protein n=1 Tax=candidate division KSB3 bacterium TaxID=2044937 RepID=A0A9D5K0J4_9BACT|nr:methyltransferase domain-containing protein [candidate division KSB3 bacterium]